MQYSVTPIRAVALLLWHCGPRWPILQRRDWAICLTVFGAVMAGVGVAATQFGAAPEALQNQRATDAPAAACLPQL